MRELLRCTCQNRWLSSTFFPFENSLVKPIKVVFFLLFQRDPGILFPFFYCFLISFQASNRSRSRIRSSSSSSSSRSSSRRRRSRSKNKSSWHIQLFSSRRVACALGILEPRNFTGHVSIQNSWDKPIKYYFIFSCFKGIPLSFLQLLKLVAPAGTLEAEKCSFKTMQNSFWRKSV